MLRLEGVHWDLEIGAVAEMIYHKKPDNPPAVPFKKIPGYPEDFTVLSGAMNSSRRLVITFRFDDPSGYLDVVEAYRNRVEDFEMINPVGVKEGPILENVDRDDDVDFYKIPAPFFHEEDGGLYIPTGYLVIMQDKHNDWVNHGTYHVKIRDKNIVGLWMSPGKHGAMIKENCLRKVRTTRY